MAKMESRIVFCIILSVLGESAISAASRSTATNCTEENCVWLRHCPHMLELLRNGRSAVSRQVVMRSQCGTEGTRLKVCCPKKENEFNVENFFPSECGIAPAVEHETRVFGGYVSSLGQFPWMAVFGYLDPDKSAVTFMCSGSVINARYVLTAAHCVHPNYIKRKKLILIRLGELNLAFPEDCTKNDKKKIRCSPPPIDAEPQKIILHPTYGMQTTQGDDIALVRLDRTINFEDSKGYILPICLPPLGFHAEFEAEDGRRTTVSGWGTTEYGGGSEVLMFVKLPFADRKRCSKVFKKNFGDKQLCIGGTEGQDSCMGDSGAPLTMDGPYGPPSLQIGIVSFGRETCGTKNYPAVYTAVSFYVDWIKSVMEPW